MTVTSAVAFMLVYLVSISAILTDEFTCFVPMKLAYARIVNLLSSPLAKSPTYQTPVAGS